MKEVAASGIPHLAEMAAESVRRILEAVAELERPAPAPGPETAEPTWEEYWEKNRIHFAPPETWGDPPRWPPEKPR